MGATQAQDYDMAKWALGLRLPGSTESAVEEALSRGDILRTHLLRPTWHLVAADDIYWLLDLTAPHVSKRLAGMNRRLELDEPILQRSNEVIERALDGNTSLTREELMGRLQQAGIRTDDLRAAHVMMHAELTGLVCSGPRRHRQFTYALLRERVPVRHRLPRGEALAELANRYFRGHGPATLKDFVWWSGLTITDARKAIELAKPHLQSLIIEAQTYWLAESVAGVLPLAEPIHFLPAFDEFMVGYSDRSASLAPEFAVQTNTGNGIFKPLIVVDGQIVGVWKRVVKPKTVSIELTFFYALPTNLIERIRERASQYAHYKALALHIVP